MTLITDLPSAPDVVDRGETFPIISPTAAGACQTTVGRIADFIASHVVSGRAVASAEWTAATTPPLLANGKLSADISTAGKARTVSLSLTIGASTILGNGRWSFSPSGYPEEAVASAIGIARAVNGGTMTIGIAEIVAGSNEIRIVSVDGGWGDTVPHAWNAGDTLDLSITYRIE